MAFHKDAGRLVGPGIVYVSGQHIQGTNDCNRSGVPRFDFVLHHRDGGYVRIHPGRTAESDAQPKYFPSSTSEAVPLRMACLQWTQFPETGFFTQTYAARVPQTDRIGNRRAFDILRCLSLPQDRDLTDGSKFLWWLWVANLGPRLSQVVGHGIALAELQKVQTDCGEVLTSFTRNDSVCFVCLSLDPRGNVKVRHWVEANARVG